MARSRNRVCRIPGCPAIQADSLCDTHKRDRDRHQRQTTPTKVTRDWAERKRRKVTVDAHRDTHGDWCPGYRRPPHPAADLTADHIDEISSGGEADGPLQVLCRSCNSTKAGHQSVR